MSCRQSRAKDQTTELDPIISLLPYYPQSAGEMTFARSTSWVDPGRRAGLFIMYIPKCIGLIQCRPGRNGKPLSRTNPTLHVDRTGPLCAPLHRWPLLTRAAFQT